MPKNQLGSNSIGETITAIKNFIGNLIGDVTGNLTGNVTGNVTGNLTGNVTGNVTGNLTGNVAGNLVGGVQETVTLASANGAISVKMGTVVLTKAGVAAMTLAAPTAVTDDGKRLTIIAGTANAHTVTQASPGFNSAGGSGDVATFGGAIGDCLDLVAYNGVWLIVATRNVTVA